MKNVFPNHILIVLKQYIGIKSDNKIIMILWRNPNGVNHD